MIRLTQALLKQLPPLRATADQADPLVIVKFFYPDFSWTWYAIEFDGTERFFGYVDGDFSELGYFSLAELKANRGKWGLPIERDRHFIPCKLSVIQAKIDERYRRSEVQ